MYDSYEHYTRFKDPGFQYGTTLVKVAGRTTLRLAEAEVLPFEFNRFTQTIDGYINEVTKLADDQRTKTEKENHLIKDGMYQLAADPKETFLVPQMKEEVPYLNFAPLHNGLHEIEKQAQTYAKVPTASLPKDRKKVLNNLLKSMERAFHPRPWPAPAPLVYSPHLRPGFLYRVRCENATGSTRGDRATRF